VSITPNTAVGPARSGDGPTRPGRLTTHEEQRQEVIRILTTRANKEQTLEQRDTVVWPDEDQTIIVVSFTKEHIDGQPVFLPDRVTEYTTSGAEIKRDPEAVGRRLRAEVEDLYEKGLV
jgi:hypothetical protein